MTAASTSAPERTPSGQPSGHGGLSNLAQRILFAVGAIPVVLGAVWIGDWALTSVLAIASALAAWEFFRIAEHLGTRPLARAGIAFAALLPLAVHARYLGLPVDAVVSLTFAAVVVLALFSAVIFARGVNGRPLASVSLTLFGVVYTGALLSFGYALRYHQYAVGRIAGTSLLMFALVLVWISDTAAYIVGRALGKRKLIPAVSPGKTVAGAVGALITCAVASWTLVRFVLVPYAQLGLRPVHAVLFGIAVSVATQLGDLAESLIKREAGVKDSSHIIPGHGGVLDRIDGMLFALPVAYWLLTAWLVPVPR
jgi:phosphatidate cytidylyltransferase